VTRDDGKTWQDVTPKGLPEWAQINAIDASPSGKGEAYVAATRYKLDDMHPYLYKTADYGRTWTKITNGIPDDVFTRVVRQDPVRRDMLFAGTENGLYLSLDGGAKWEPFQGNLPPTPVTDLTIKNGDLVVATQGRSFWILDDLTPLHQLRDEVLGAGKFLLKPRDEVRNPPHIAAAWGGTVGGKNYHVTSGQNATFYVQEHDTGHTSKRVIDGGDDLARGVRISYYLDERAVGDAVLTISDAAGNLVDTFPSTIPEEKKDRHGLYITADAGMNSFLWPMTFPAGEKMVDTEFHTRPGGPLAKPGTYQATLTVGDWSMSQTFELLKDPRISTSDADFAEQLDLLLKIRDKLSEIVIGVNTIRALKKQLAEWVERLSGDESAADVVTSAKELIDRLSDVENHLVQVEFTADGDTLNYREMLFEKLSSLPAVVASADTRPTVQSYAVYDKLAGQADVQLDALKALREGELAKLNGRLAELQVAIIGL
jgi:hypothetical protein